MKITFLPARLVALIVVIACTAGYYHYYFLRCHDLGRDRFLAYQAFHFDMYMNAPSWSYPLYSGVVIGVVLIVVYEAVSGLTQMLLSKNHSNNTEVK